MSSVYKVSKDPKGLLKKPPTYFFHNYKSESALSAKEPIKKNSERKNISPENLRTKDFDDLVSVNGKSSSTLPDDGTVIYGVTSTPPEKVVKPTKEEYDETDRLMMQTFKKDKEEKNNSAKHNKHKKKRGEKIRSTVQVDEDIRSLYADEEQPVTVEETASPTDEVDHGPLSSEDDYVTEDDNPYDVLESDDDELAQGEDADIDEYTDPEDAEKFKDHFRTKSIIDTLLGFAALIVFAALLYVEGFSFMPEIPRPKFLEPENFRLVLILVDIQFLVISGAIIYESFIDGVKALFTGKPNSNTVTVSVILICLIHAVVMCFTSTPETLTLYSSVGAFFAALGAFRSALENRRNLYTFEVLASDGEKYVAEKSQNAEGELHELGEFLPDDPDIFTLKKTKFVDDAVKNIETPARAEQNFKVILPLILIVSLVYAAVIYITGSDMNSAMNAFTVMSLVTLPLSSLLYISLPYFIESEKIAQRGCAMVGGNSFEEYSLASVVSFNDVEVMPSRGIKVTSVRTYGDHRIDHTLMYAARIFKTVGGPLAPVFENCIKNAVDDIQPVEITSVEPDGISAVIDGTEVFIGKKSFMLAYNFGFVKDSMDDAFENSIGRIMYMTIGDNIAAKFYIKYSIYKGFEKILANLAKVGICVGIKTCDPNIDEALLNKLLHRKEYPVRIIKSETPLPSDDVASNASSGLVCTSNAFNMLRAFLSCDKVAKNVSLNIGAKFISMFLGFAIILFLSIIGGGNISAVTPWFIVIYQLLWLMPTVATAFLG